jgi:Domain of unknown function (DUF3885)
MSIVFGPDWQRALWTSRFRLRFELNTGGTHVNMFTSAYDRARVLARAALPLEEIVAIIAANPDPSTVAGADWRGWSSRNPFEILDEMGVLTSNPNARWLGYVYPSDGDDPESPPLEHRAVRLTWDQADILLWNNVACDMGVFPQAPVISKLVDVERHVTVYAYDDRGMDIAASDPEQIRGLYTQFDAWLLDYDRPRMSAAFETA